MATKKNETRLDAEEIKRAIAEYCNKYGLTKDIPVPNVHIHGTGTAIDNYTAVIIETVEATHPYKTQ